MINDKYIVYIDYPYTHEYYMHAPTETSRGMTYDESLAYKFSTLREATKVRDSLGKKAVIRVVSDYEC